MYMPMLIILLIIMTIMTYSKFNKYMKKNCMMPFECGFSLIKYSPSISIQFSLISFIFLVFDIELSILIIMNNHLVNYEWIISMLLFSLTMLMSIMFEMTKNSMQWIK